MVFSAIALAGNGTYTFWVFGLYATCVFYIQIAKPGTFIPVFDVVLLMIAMLSGPFAPVSFGLWLVLQFRHFDRRLWAIATVLALCCAIQAYTFLTVVQDDSAGQISAILVDVPDIIMVFFGSIAPMILPILIVAGVLNTGVKASLFAGGLITFSMFIAAYRVGNIHLIDQFGGGPRYFYYPYTIVMVWALSSLWLGNRTAIQRVTRALSATIIAILVLISFPEMRRFHEHVDWRAEVDDCRFAVVDEQVLVYFDGTLQDPWSSELTNAQCDRLVRASLIPLPQRSQSLPHTPREDRYYESCSTNGLPTRAAGASIATAEGFAEWEGTVTSANATGTFSSIEMLLAPGALIGYRNGPQAGQQFVEFLFQGDEVERVTLAHATSWRYLSPPDGATAMRVINAGNATDQWTAIIVGQ